MMTTNPHAPERGPVSVDCDVATTEGALLANVIVEIRTTDERLYERMDAAISKALDELMGVGDSYIVDTTWTNEPPVDPHDGYEEVEF